MDDTQVFFSVFRNIPIEPYIFKLRFSHPKIDKWIETQTGKKTTNNYETDTVSFKINKINITKI